MNDKLKQFIGDVGILCEMWLVIYNSFIEHGLNAKDALMHTQSFMTATMNSSSNKSPSNADE